MVGFKRTNPDTAQVGGADYFDLFSVQPTGSGRATVTMVASKHVTCHGCALA